MALSGYVKSCNAQLTHPGTSPEELPLSNSQVKHQQFWSTLILPFMTGAGIMTTPSRADGLAFPIVLVA